MNILKKAGLLSAILIIAGLNIFVYLNSHLYYRAMSEEDAKKKISFLEKSNNYCPLNDLAFYELGKAYLDLGLQNLGDLPESTANLQKAIQNLKQSIRINPASPFAHFYLAQALLQLDVYAPGQGKGFIEEYKTASRLAGEDSRIFYEVSRVFLSQWPKLSAGDQEFTVDVLKRVLGKRKSDQILLLLNIWEMNAPDYGIMNKVLPQDSQILRIYARFLGEKSLDLEERQKALAKAERLEFERARDENGSGEMDLFNSRIAEAFRHFSASLDLLNGIRFYQTLRLQNLIDAGEFTQLLRSTWLNLAKCRIEERAGLAEVERYLRPYLALEDRPREIGDLETYLRARGVLPARFSRALDDPERLAFELMLLYKQSRYRDIMGLGRELEGSFVVVPEAKKTEYVRILQFVGDSYQKIDFIYDAGDVYRRALEAEPENLEMLLRLRQNYDRLNDAQRVREIDILIEKVMAPNEIVFKDKALNKGQLFTQDLIFDGRKAALEVEFGGEESWASEGSGAGSGGLIPLVSVFFNGRVVWEGYLKARTVAFTVDTRAGDNELQIAALNRAATLVKISHRSDERREVQR